MKIKKQKGIALAVTLMVLLILVVVAMSIGSIGVFNLRHVSNYRDSIIAYYAAKAGVAQAADKLRGDSNWNAVIDGNLEENGATYSVTFDNTKQYYSTNNISKEFETTGWYGVSVPARHAYIISTGTFNRQTRRVAAMIFWTSSSQSPTPTPTPTPTSTPVSSVSSSIFDYAGSNPPFLFKYAIFGNDSIAKTGSGSTNGFDSSISTYPYTMLNAGGDIATNSASSSSPYAVNITGSGTIYGTVYVGSDGTPSTAIHKTGSGSYVASGSLPAPQSMPAVIDPLSGATSNGNKTYTGSGDQGTLATGKYGNFNKSGSCDLTLTSGNYSFTSFTQTGSGEIKIDASGGPVNIFVNGDINFTGSGFTNTTHLASNVRFWGTSSCTSVDIVGSAEGYYFCYAPNADIDIMGTADIYGSVVGKTVTLVGSGCVRHDAILSDLSLETLTITSGGTFVTSTPTGTPTSTPTGTPTSTPTGSTGTIDIITWQNIY